jgi:hypothetical protein
MKIALRIEFVFFVSLFSICSCIRGNKVKHTSQNKKLLSSQSKFTYGADDVEKLDSAIYNGIASYSLNKKTDTIKYLKGEIYISCLRITSGCSEYIGDIQFNKDTIKLITINTSDTVCSESNVWRIIYKIANKDNKRYIIKKD